MHPTDHHQDHIDRWVSNLLDAADWDGVNREFANMASAISRLDRERDRTARNLWRTSSAYRARRTELLDAMRTSAEAGAA